MLPSPLTSISSISQTYTTARVSHKFTLCLSRSLCGKPVLKFIHTQVCQLLTASILESVVRDVVNESMYPDWASTHEARLNIPLLAGSTLLQRQFWVAKDSYGSQYIAQYGTGNKSMKKYQACKELTISGYGSFLLPRKRILVDFVIVVINEPLCMKI